jgi:hypothetical protein
MMNRYLNLIILILAVVFAGCNNQKSSKQLEQGFDDVVVDDAVKMIEKYPMPSSYEMIEFLNNSGAGYVFDITNPAENVSNYISYKQKSINLGIYAADLIYTITYQKNAETAVYLDNFVQLVEDLEISNLNREFFQSVQSNLDNKDSLLILIKGAQYDTHKNLEENNKNEVALYALAGSWIEGMYLMSATLKFAENQQAIYEKMLQNRSSLNDLLMVMSPYKDEAGFQELYQSLANLMGMINNAHEGRKKEEKLVAIKDYITELRNSLI